MTNNMATIGLAPNIVEEIISKSSTPTPPPKHRSSSVSTSHSDDHLMARDLTPCKNWSLFLSLTIRSLGVIFGDIGTSPLYVMNTIFTFEPSEAQCIGSLSLIIWNLIIVVTIKYGVFILGADNEGEGGTFALCALLTGERSTLSSRAKQRTTVVSLSAACFLVADGALTPAVSVLSAIEGLAVEAPNLQVYIVPITIVILVGLFFVQRWGTSKIGITFGPIMVVWFSVLFMIGIWQITYQPRILKAFNPLEAFEYLLREKRRGFLQIGGVYLAVTGLEALYADMGHVGRGPIRFSWFCFVFPALVTNYLGQGALLINDPSLIDNPFYHSVPKGCHWPMVVLATLATLIASQAIITASFSLISQAIAMECSVPCKIIHTSKTIMGQIYVPAMNFVLMILTIIVTLIFQTSADITNAYGFTVCSVMLLTTILYMCVMRYTWQKKVYQILPFGIFLIIDSFTWSANATKIAAGGWDAVVIGTCLSIVSFSWYFGQLQLRRFLKIHAPTTKLRHLAMRLGLDKNIQQNSVTITTPDLLTANRITYENESNSDSDSDIDYRRNTRRVLPKNQNRILLVKNVPIISSNNIPIYFQTYDISMYGTIPVTITPGAICFLTTSKHHTPHVFESFLLHMHSVPQVIIFLLIEFASKPTIENDKRVTLKSYGENIFHITALFGYSESRIEPFEILSLARTLYQLPIPDDERKVTLLVSHEKIKVLTIGWRSWFRRWPLYIYSIFKSHYPGPAMYIKINPENCISICILAKLD